MDPTSKITIDKKTRFDFKCKILNETFKIFVFLFLVAVCVSLNIVIFGF